MVVRIGERSFIIVTNFKVVINLSLSCHSRPGSQLLGAAASRVCRQQRLAVRAAARTKTKRGGFKAPRHMPGHTVYSVNGPSFIPLKLGNDQSMVSIRGQCVSGGEVLTRGTCPGGVFLTESRSR